MHLGIVSTEFVGFDRDRHAPTYETRRISEVLTSRGGEVVWIDPSRIMLHFERQGLSISYADKFVGRQVFETLDAVLVRRTRHMAEQVCDLVRVLTVLLPSLTLLDPGESFRDPLSKVESLITRAAEGIPHARTLVCLGTNIGADEIDLRYPVLSKPTYGTQAHGIRVARSAQELQREINRASQHEGEGYGPFFQELLEIDCEYRVFVIGGRAIALARRRREAGYGTWDMSAMPAASFESCPDDENARRLAERAAGVHSYAFAGVDIARVGGEYLVLECNRNPQFEKLEAATGIDVAAQIVDYIAVMTEAPS